MPSGLVSLFNVYSSSQHFAALIASAFLPIRQNFLPIHMLGGGLSASSSYLCNAALCCLPLLSNQFPKYLVIFGWHWYLYQHSYIYIYLFFFSDVLLLPLFISLQLT